MGFLELLLLATPGAPALLTILWPMTRRRRVLMAVAPWATLPALALALHPEAAGVALTLPPVFMGLHLALDAPGQAFLLLTSLLWLLAGTFAGSYHARDPHREGFFGFFVLTMTGNLGLVVAADVLSFYLFFAVMTFAGYGLVVHRGDQPARRAGRIYIVMAILGEVLLLAALLALGWAGQEIPLFGDELGRAWSVLQKGGWGSAVAVLVVAGFGVKAGVVPLHLWLPLAHPVAPTAASALLSGVMIKAGLLAWLRHLPADLAFPEVGALLAAVGVFTAFYGVAVGLAQDDAKTVLAYSSVSQMGYMALGVGLLLRDPGWAPVGLLAVVFFALHHGMTKAALFLAVGVGDRVGGGRSRRASFVLVGAALPALVLAGAPLTTGATSKGLIKSALGRLAPEWYGLLEPVLLVASAGTTLLMARFLVTFWARMRRRLDAKRNGPEPRGSRGAGLQLGLFVPWLVLVALGAGGLLWIPWAVALPAGAELPGVWEGFGGAAGPLVAAALVSWVIWRWPGLLGRVRGLRLPAGDLVVVFEALARNLRRLPWGVLEKEWGRTIIRGIHRGQLWVHARAAWAAERDLRLADGPVVGLIFVGLGVALGLVLFWG